MAALIDATAIARRLGLSMDSWYRKRKDLERAGFPPPLPPFTNRWSEAAVDAWIDRQTKPPATADSAADPAAPADWTDILKHRARSGAGLQ